LWTEKWAAVNFRKHRTKFVPPKPNCLMTDLGARSKVPEWGVFCHTARLRNRPARLKLALTDSAVLFIII
jgi:hypothetical protein